MLRHLLDTPVNLACRAGAVANGQRHILRLGDRWLVTNVWKLDRHRLLNHLRGDQEDDQEHQHDVGQRDHVDVRQCFFFRF